MAQHKTICADAVVIDEQGVKLGYAPTTFDVYICAKCDNTHIEINLGGTKFCFAWKPDDAEALANMLINPQPLAAEHMGLVIQPRRH